MLVSIVMPTYNAAEYIAASVESVLAQTVTDWELLIADDGSTDTTTEVLQKYLALDPRIKYEALKSNSGAAQARNNCLRRARGKYIAFLDSDDIWLPDKLEKQISFMERTDCDFSCTAYQIIDTLGNETNERVYPRKKTNYQQCILRSNPIGNLTAMYRHDRIGEVAVPEIRKRNDFALWLQILKKTEYCYGMDEVLALYRTGRSQSISGNKWDQAYYHWYLYRTIEKHSYVRCVFEIGCWLFIKGTKHFKRFLSCRKVLK